MAVENNNNNKIRPVKIRIVNPTPKSIASPATSVSPIKQRKRSLTLLFYLLIGFIMYFAITVSGVFNFFSNLSEWKQQSIQYLLLLLLTFIIPCFIYYMVNQKRIYFTMNKPLFSTSFFSFILGFPLAYLAGTANYFVSIFLRKIGVIDYLYYSDSIAKFFRLNNPIFAVIFIIIICILPSLIFEITLRDFFFQENLKKMKQRHVIFISSILTGCFMLNLELFLPYLLLGYIVSSLVINHISAFYAILCHFSFSFTYHILMNHINWLKISQQWQVNSDLRSMFPIILKFLLASCLFIPIFIVLSQTKKINPFTQSDEMVARHIGKKESSTGLNFFCLFMIFILYITIQLI